MSGRRRDCAALVIKVKTIPTAKAKYASGFQIQSLTVVKRLMSTSIRLVTPITEDELMLYTSQDLSRKSHKIYPKSANIPNIYTNPCVQAHNDICLRSHITYRAGFSQCW